MEKSAFIVPGDRLAILLVWLGSLVLAFFVVPNHQQAEPHELLYYSVYNVAAGALVGFGLFDRLARRSVVGFAAAAGLALVLGTLIDEALVEPYLFRTGPINFEGVYYGLLESTTAAILFLLLRMFGSGRIDDRRRGGGDSPAAAPIARSPARPPHCRTHCRQSG